MRARLLTRGLVCLSLGALALLPLSQAAAGAGTETLSAKEILDRVASTYAGCRSYQDSGVVLSWFKEGQHETKLTFSTAFVRPGRFRFQYEDVEAGSRYVTAANGDDVRAWGSVKAGIDRLDSLEKALGRVAGTSVLSSRLIPSLLLPDQLAGNRLTGMTDLKRLEDASLEDTGCFRLQGVYGSAAKLDLTLWIEKSTFLVRRIDSRSVFEDGGRRIESLTAYTYQPVMNGDVPEERLAFDPPAGVASGR